MSPEAPGMTGIDSNVLLRYLLQDDEGQYRIAAELFESLTPEAPGFVTQITLAETYWVLARSVRLAPRDCLAVLRQVFESQGLEFDDAEAVGRALVLAEQGADFADALIQGAMELFGITRTVTFDRRAADRLGWSLLQSESR